VGGVMAYYFGKENFKAGSESVQNTIRQLTPQQKLEGKKAGESGMEMTQAAVHKLTGLLPDVSLTDLENSFKRDGKTYERLPILDSAKCVVACLHLSTLNKFRSLSDAEQAAGGDKTKLSALCVVLKWKPEDSFATVAPTDSLASAQAIMKANKNCRDVFVTPDGKKNTPAQRWITDDDILNVVNG
jgi:hypothetical protein